MVDLKDIVAPPVLDMSDEAVLVREAIKQARGDYKWGPQVAISVEVLVKILAPKIRALKCQG